MQTKFLLSALSATLLSAPLHAESVASTNWKPTASQLARLAPADGTTMFTLSVPKGHTFVTGDAPSDTSGTAWEGPKRSDGTRAWVMVAVLTPPPGEADKYTISQVLTKFMHGVQARRDDWKESPQENGTIGSLPCVRAHWKGADKTTAYKMGGAIYILRVGNQFVELSSQDILPQHQDDLSLSEASILTFKPK